MKIKKLIILNICLISLISLNACNQQKQIEPEIIEDKTIENDIELFEKYNDGINVESILIEKKEPTYIEEEKNFEIYKAKEIKNKTEVKSISEEIIQASSNINQPLFKKTHLTIDSLSYAYESEEGYINVDLYEKDILINTYEEYQEILNEINLYLISCRNNEHKDFLINNLNKYDESFFSNNSLYLYATNNSTSFLNYKGEFLEENNWIFKYEYDTFSIINGFVQHLFFIEMDKNIANNSNNFIIDISGNF